jgi:hypothetical protein
MLLGLRFSQRWLWRVLCSGSDTSNPVEVTDTSEERTDSIFRIEEEVKWEISNKQEPDSAMQYVPPKRWWTTGEHGITYQEIELLIKQSISLPFIQPRLQKYDCLLAQKELTDW